MSKVDTVPDDEEIIVELMRGSFFAYYHLGPAKLKLRERAPGTF